MSDGVLDRAANVRQKMAEVKELCANLRQAGSNEWTSYGIAATDIESVAMQNLQHAWTLLDGVRRLASIEMDRLKEADSK